MLEEICRLFLFFLMCNYDFLVREFFNDGYVSYCKNRDFYGF